MAKYSKITANGLTLASSAKYCNSFYSRFRGLMFSKKLKEKEGLIIDVCLESRELSSIHMVFVFFSIDVLWLDSKKKVVDLRRDVKPFYPFIIPKDAARYVIELPKMSTLAVKVGDILEFD